jgi:transposase-like protein
MAAVLDWRLPEPAPTNPGPLPWLPGIPTALHDHPVWGQYLAKRSQLVTDLANRIRGHASQDDTQPVWAPPGSRPNAAIIGEVAVWRAASGIHPSDPRPTGGTQLETAPAIWKQGTVGLTVELAGLKSERSQTMTDTIDDVAAEGAGPEPVEPAFDEQCVAEQLVAQAREKGIELVGPNGLLSQLTKRVLETALEAEMTDHLGYDKHDPMGRNRGNSRNGVRSKTVLTEIGPVEIEVPRDVEATFTPQIVQKRQRRLTGVDQIVLSLSARGLTTGEIAAHFAEVYGASMSRETVSKITDQVLEEMSAWMNRPLDEVYPVLFIDAIVVKVRDGQVRNKPIYVVIGVTVNGERDILGLWAGDGNEGAKFWLQILTELKNRGVTDVCIAVCDGLKGLPETINTVWELTTVQACIIHLIRNTFRYASRKYWDQIARDLRPVYTAATEAEAGARFSEFADKWGRLYPAITKLWQNAWSEFIPFLDYDVEIRKVICSTNAIESINARYRRAVRVRGHFPNEQAALKCLYLTTRSLDPTGNGKARWATRWKPALNAFAVTFEGRIPTR